MTSVCYFPMIFNYILFWRGERGDANLVHQLGEKQTVLQWESR